MSAILTDSHRYLTFSDRPMLDYTNPHEMESKLMNNPKLKEWLKSYFVTLSWGRRYPSSNPKATIHHKQLKSVTLPRSEHMKFQQVHVETANVLKV